MQLLLHPAHATRCWKNTSEQEHKAPSISDQGLRPWLIGCLMATVPPCGSHPTQSPLQISKSSEETQDLFPQKGWAGRASFCLHQNTHHFQIQFTEYFVYCPVPNLRPFIGQRGGMKDMKEENGAELLAGCCRLESRQVGTEMKQVLKRVIYSGETRALSDIWVRERNQYPWFPLVFRVLKAEVVAEV